MESERQNALRGRGFIIEICDLRFDVELLIILFHLITFFTFIITYSSGRGGSPKYQFVNSPVKHSSTRSMKRFKMTTSRRC